MSWRGKDGNPLVDVNVACPVCGKQVSSEHGGLESHIRSKIQHGDEAHKKFNKEKNTHE